MATDAGRTGGERKAERQPASLLERIIRSSSSAELVGAMVTNGINIPEDMHDGSPLRLQLARSIKMPLDDEQRNLITMFILRWLDSTDPAKVKVRTEARNAATVKPHVISLIADLKTANDHRSTVTTNAAKRDAVERKLDEMIGKIPGRPEADANPVISSIMGQGAGGNGNDLISAMLVLNELGENSPLPFQLGPRRTEPIERRREWAANAAKVLAGLVLVFVLAISLVLGAWTHWMVGAIAAVVLVVVVVKSLASAAKAIIGWLLKKAFPQFDEDGFREKVIKQCETTLKYLGRGITATNIVDWGLEHKFLEEVDGELRKEGFVYNRFDEQIDDWVREFLGLTTVRRVAPKVNPIDRASDWLNEHL